MEKSHNEITKQLDNIEQKLEIIKLTLEFDADREELSIREIQHVQDSCLEIQFLPYIRLSKPC